MGCSDAFWQTATEMRILIDTDVFCKLGVSDLLQDALSVFGVGLADSGRLPALPYMLRKGPLRRIYGAAGCTKLMQLTARIPSVGIPDSAWLDRLAGVPSIDPGEAQLFALAASRSLLVMTGDKRALRALSEVEGYPGALAGRIVVLEAMLLELCERLGADTVKARLGAVATTDVTLRVCFSDDNRQPDVGLESYFRKLGAEVNPLRLWEPPTRGIA